MAFSFEEFLGKHFSFKNVGALGFLAGFLGLFMSEEKIIGLFGGGKSGHLDFSSSTTLSGNVMNTGMKQIDDMKIGQLGALAKEAKEKGVEVPAFIVEKILEKNYGKNLLEGAKTFADIENKFQEKGALQAFTNTKPEDLKIVQGNILTAKSGNDNVQLVVDSFDPKTNSITVNYFTKKALGLDSHHEQFTLKQNENGSYSLVSAPDKKGNVKEVFQLENNLITEKFIKAVDPEGYKQKLEQGKFTDPFADKPTLAQGEKVSTIIDIRGLNGVKQQPLKVGEEQGYTKAKTTGLNEQLINLKPTTQIG